jgi:DNA-directed RNA polymerase specialized sigma24 family protein
MTKDGYGQAYQHGFLHTVRFLMSRGIREDVARDVAQSAWTKGWERLGQLRNDSVLTTWVNAIALNAYRGILRREPAGLALPEISATETNLARIDISRILRFCRPGERVLLERQLIGETTEEIAEHEGVTNTAIRIRLLRLRRKMRERVMRRGAGR